jgi:hypothetical protein
VFHIFKTQIMRHMSDKRQSALLAGVLTSTGSWPNILPNGEESPWSVRTSWYCGIILSLFSILSAADQTSPSFIAPRWTRAYSQTNCKARKKSLSEERSSSSKSSANHDMADAGHVLDQCYCLHDCWNVLACLVSHDTSSQARSVGRQR